MSIEIEPNPQPLEITHPSLSTTFQQIANGNHPRIQRINVGRECTTLWMKDDSIRRLLVIQPNDKCHCGSNVKFKKCCRNKPEPKLMCRFCNKEVLGVKDPQDTKTCRCYDPKQTNEK